MSDRNPGKKPGKKAGKPDRSGKSGKKKPKRQTVTNHGATNHGATNRDSGNHRGRSLAYWGAIAGIWLLIGLCGLTIWTVMQQSGFDQLGAAQRKPVVTLLDSDGDLLARFGNLYGESLSLNQVPEHLLQAVMATEDRRFYEHSGFDIKALARAMWVNVTSGRVVQGGSTLTQQLAKNLFLTPERTFYRKWRELVLALRLELRFSKEEILAMYLNRVYLGAGTYGVDAAAQRYFGVVPAELSLRQSAVLAGLLKAPSRYAPTSNLDRSLRRADQVLVNMVDAGYLTEAQANVAKADNLGLVKRAKPRRARYFADWILARLPDYIGHTAQDLTVKTTLQGSAQRAAERAVADAGKAMKAGRAGQVALVSMSPGGAVRAMVGGRDYRASQFNRATQARRQPGSAFKLFVYLAALEAGLTPDIVMRDSPIILDGWRPRNYSGGNIGHVDLRTAFAKSINTVAVKLSERVDRKRVIETARRLGVTSDIPPHPSLALGTASMRLIELTSAYAVLANDGYGLWAHGITEIRASSPNGNGTILYRRQGDGPGRVVSQSAVGQMTSMLVEAIVSGTGKAARITRPTARPVAGKTGTSQDFRDAWFVGYSADLVTGVWVGNDNGSAMKKVTGGGIPARLWKSYMVAAHKDLPPRPLPGTATAPADFFRSLWQQLTGD